MSTQPRNSKTTNNLVRHDSSHNPDYVGEISFVELLTNDLTLIVSQEVRMTKAQYAKIEQEIKKYLNKAL